MFCPKARWYSGHTTNVQEVKEAVEGWKRGKQDRSHSIDQIINGTTMLYTDT